MIWMTFIAGAMFWSCNIVTQERALAAWAEVAPTTGKVDPADRELVPNRADRTILYRVKVRSRAGAVSDCVGCSTRPDGNDRTGAVSAPSSRPRWSPNHTAGGTTKRQLMRWSTNNGAADCWCDEWNVAYYCRITERLILLCLTL